MPLTINTLSVDCREPETVASFWADTLGWIRLEGDEVMIAPGTSPADLPGAFPILFVAASDEKIGKNRLHLDLVPDDQASEVVRLEGLGARRIDIGQNTVSWVVMADPEGNEFCILRSFEG